MSKHTRQDKFFAKSSLSFIEFWSFISSQVGVHRLDINASAQCLTDLFSPNAVHPEYLKELVVNSLPSRSGKLNQTINLTSLLDSLGHTAFALRQNSNDDLLDIELLEEIAWYISERFLHLVDVPPISQLKQSQHPHIIPIKKFKTKT